MAVLAATVVGLLRQPGVGALDTIWAEDGSIFLTDNERHGLPSALTISYAGYFHLVPRLLAAVAGLFPAEAVAAVLAVEAALCVGLVALLVYVASAGLLRNRLSRFAVAAAVVVVPVGQVEIINSIANLQWYGLYALFWVLLWVPSSRAGRVSALTVTLLVTGSSILALVFLPLVICRALYRRTPESADRASMVRHGLLLAGAFATGMAFQFAGLLIGSSERATSPDPVVAIAGFALRAVPGPLIGARWLGADVGARWVSLAAVAWLIVALALLLAYAGKVRPAVPLAVAAWCYAAALYILPVLLAGVATPRYAVAPAMLLITALVAVVQPAGGTRLGRIPLSALVALLALVAGVNLRLDNPRADGPSWQTELDGARRACHEAGVAEIPIAPGPPPTWIVKFPCDHL